MKDQLTIEQIFAGMQAIADSIGPNCYESMSLAIQRAKDIEERARIKPAEPERDYPRTQLTGHRLAEIRDEKYAGTGPKFYLTQIVNDAFRHACDNGQIVTRAEFDRAVGDRAARDMAVAEAMKSAALDWAGRQLTSMPKRLENIDTGAVIASVK